MHYEINLHALTCDLVHVTPFFVMFVVTVEPFPFVEGGGGEYLWGHYFMVTLIASLHIVFL